MMSMFKASAGYESYMGRWSRLLARKFIEFAGVREGERVLDVGSGTGSLAASLERALRSVEVVGVDPSAEFVEFARQNRASQRVRFELGDAQALGFPAGSFDAAMALLVINFVPDPAKALGEMRRVTRAGGKVAACVWDYGAGMQSLRVFWDEAVALDPAIAAKDERNMKLSHAGELASLWRSAGLLDVEEGSLAVEQRFRSFDDYWQPFLEGVGPGGACVGALAEERRRELAARLEQRLLPEGRDRPFALQASAWCVKGRVP
jgi:SAM-dependent methyltransferase